MTVAISPVVHQTAELTVCFRLRWHRAWRHWLRRRRILLLVLLRSLLRLLLLIWLLLLLRKWVASRRHQRRRRRLRDEWPRSSDQIASTCSQTSIRGKPSNCSHLDSQGKRRCNRSCSIRKLQKLFIQNASRNQGAKAHVHMSSLRLCRHRSRRRRLRWRDMRGRRRRSSRA